MDTNQLLASYSSFIDQTLKFEGHYSNDKTDPGGETKYGISQVYHKNLKVKNLTLDEAKAIYARQYLVPAIKHRSLHYVVFDCKVTGHRVVLRRVQELMNEMGHNLKVDGIIGSASIASLNSLNASQRVELLRRIHSEASNLANVMAKLQISNRKARGLPYTDYSRGWTNRIRGRVDFALSLES